MVPQIYSLHLHPTLFTSVSVLDLWDEGTAFVARLVLQIRSMIDLKALDCGVDRELTTQHYKLYASRFIVYVRIRNVVLA